jgi:hypothetical protein
VPVDGNDPRDAVQPGGDLRKRVQVLSNAFNTLPWRATTRNSRKNRYELGPVIPARVPEPNL